MNEANERTITKINEKLNWAIYSLDCINKSEDDLNLIKYNFWSFITAFQQSWYYYNQLIELKFPSYGDNRKKKEAINLINQWKIHHLEQNELKHWDLISKLRNFDTHTEPVIPEILKKNLFITFEGKYVTHQGKKIVLPKTVYIIQFDDFEYNIIDIAKNGISAIQKLILYISSFIKTL